MSPWFPRWQIGGTCLLVETDKGLALVDTGLGLHDYSNPSSIVRFFTNDFGIDNNPENTAIRQITRLGYSPKDVHDIVMTHLHFDHAGGIPDFPHTQVHVHRLEFEAMQHPHSFMELAYDRADFIHKPSWVTYDLPDTDWLGFKTIRLPFSPEMYLVPLFGHTKGHCGVVVKYNSGWIFNCADALPTNAQFDLTPTWLNRLIIGSHVPRLQAFASTHPEVLMLAGHMWKSFFEEHQLLPE
jgi:glyoxylase-like metal-dependent hydrolase (beta-lactamase superfamily II)